jgi:hypothetical protein
MTGMQSLAARAALGVITASAGLVAVSIERFQQASSRTFDRYLQAAFAASRLGLYALLFFVLRIAPRGDVVGFYFDEAIDVLRHQVPYRDFVSSYAPLHPYLDGAIIYFWRSPLPLILLAILAEIVLLPVLLRLGRELFAERSVRLAALLYVASPISLQFVAVDGQDTVIITLLMSLAILCLMRNRVVLSGALLAAGIALIKFLPLLYVPAFFFAAQRRVRWLLGFGAVLLLGYGGFALRHINLLAPLALEDTLKTASNLPFVIQLIFGFAIPDRAGDVFLLLVLLGAMALIASAMHRAGQSHLPNPQPHPRLRVLLFGVAVLTLALLVFSKKSWPPYLILALFPICLLVVDRARSWLRLVAFALFSVVAVVGHSVWSTVFGEVLAPAIHASLVSKRPAAFVFLVLQMLLVAGYLWLFAEALKRLTGPSGSTVEAAQ